ncbi:MAG: ABC transporter substrate-binding protein [Deltaproteobacteria bacterium]|nr:ABC transporter substrate-binding protein [Candidatus Tharpellaceae bacterium]
MKKRLFLVIALSLALCFVGTTAMAAKTIKIGGMFDITGGTGAVGTPYAEGVRDYVRYINDNGGINGKMIELLDVDYAYKIPQALAAYKKFKSAGVVAIQGWGTGDTEAMSPIITKDHIPYMSASYSEHLTNAAITPYNFMVGTTYADQARVALKYIATNWTDKSRKPRVALIYNDTGFGRSPFFDVDYHGHHFPAAEAYAKEVGVDVVCTPVVGLRALDATPQLLSMKQKDPDYAIVQETSVMATILKDAKKLGLRTKFFALNWAMSQQTMLNAGAAAEGCYWTNPFAVWSDVHLPGVKKAREISEKYHPGKVQLVNYFQGFVAMQVMAEAISRIEGKITGETIKAALENIKDFDTGGLTVPITFTKESHKGSLGLRIYQVKDAKLVPVTGKIIVKR